MLHTSLVRGGSVAVILGSLAATAVGQGHAGVPYRPVELPRPAASVRPTAWVDVGLFAPLGDRVVFFANDGWTSGREPWVSDGTPEGTHLLSELDPRMRMDLSPTAVMPMSSGGVPKVAVLGQREGGLALAIVDGSGAFTITAPGAFLGSAPLEDKTATFVGTLGERVLLMTTTSTSRQNELWISGGDEAVRLAAWPEFYFPQVLPQIAERAGVAYLWTGGVGSYELWRTDGTPEGTRRILGPVQGPTYMTPGSTLLGDRIFSATGSPGSYRIGVTDLATDTTSSLALPAGVRVTNQSQVIARSEQGFVLFSTDGGLWRTDGTAEGTALFKAGVRAEIGDAVRQVFNPTIGPPGALKSVFAGTTGWPPELEPWVTDGTPEGTTVLGTINPDGRGLQPLGSDSRFAWFALGTQVWRTNGTPEGTVSGYPELGSAALRPVGAAAEGRLFYIPASDRFSTVLACGVDAGVTTLRPGPGPLVAEGPSVGVLAALGDLALFPARGPSGEMAWYGSDGTARGTGVLTDGVGPVSTSRYTRQGTAGGASWLLTRSADFGTTQVWRTDGTPEGTIRIGTKAASSSGRTILAGGDGIVFYSDAIWTAGSTPGSLRRISAAASTTYDDLAVDRRGRIYHGVSANESLVPCLVDLAMGTTTALNWFQQSLFYPLAFTPVGDRMFYQNRSSTDGGEVWRTDGTAGGSSRFFTPGLAPVRCGTGITCTRIAAPAGVELHFVDAATGASTLLARFKSISARLPLGDRTIMLADDGMRGTEPWITDGTPQGTRMIVETAPGFYGATTRPNLNAPDVRDDRLFFVVAAPDLTYHAWVSDGTAEGTMPLGGRFEDPARTPSAPYNFTTNQGAVWFRAWTPETGDDLFAVRLCEADFSCDGFLDSSDYLGYVDAFEAGTPDADFNGDGFVDFFDYGGFVDAFERGC